MAEQDHDDTLGLGQRAHLSALLVIAKLWPGQDFHTLEDRFNRLSLRQQTEVTASVLGYLFLLALFAGQFGILGIMLYLAALLVTIR